MSQVFDLILASVGARGPRLQSNETAGQRQLPDCDSVGGFVDSVVSLDKLIPMQIFKRPPNGCCLPGQGLIGIL